MKAIPVCLLLLFTFHSIQSFSLEKILITDAHLEKPGVDGYIDGTDAEFEGSIFDIVGDGFYYGTCLRIHIVNSSDTEFTLVIPAGIYLVSEDSTIQNMLTTKTEEILISAYDSSTYPIYAMCAQIEKSSPNDGYYFSIGEPIDNRLTVLAHFLDEENIQDDAGQLCVWAISDNASYYKLDSFSDNEDSIDKSYAILKKLDINIPFTMEYEQRKNIMKKVAYFGIGFLMLAGFSLLYILVWRKRGKTKA